MSSALEILVPVLGGFLAAAGALLAVLWLAPGGRAVRPPLDSDSLSEPRQFLFRNGYLTEHSQNVSFLLPDPIDHLRAWDDLVDALSDIGDGVAAAFAALRDAGQPFRLTGAFGRDRVVVLGLRDGPEMRITVSTAEERQGSLRIDLPSLRAMETEMSMLARAGDSNPALSWAIDAEGRVIWSNAAYLDLVGRCAGPDAARGWPLHALFPDTGSGQPDRSRRKARGRDGQEFWFDVTTTAADADGMRHGHAIPLDAVIKAEDSLRTFIQTLTKSFAFLPSGLAIFDRQGQLALFNPALMDMTGLDGAWLSRRPRLADFFDALRDRQKLPEPRDYKTWRDSLTDIARTGSQGTYTETWSIADGTVYRVTGRPQGDGAVTLMLEDVSADVRADRTHRTEREMLGGLLDGLDDGVIAFDAEGHRLFCNDAARRLWFGDDGDAMLPATLDGCIAFWKTVAAPTPAWGELRGFLLSPERERAEWSETVRRPGQPDLDLRIAPLPGNRIALFFRPDVAGSAHLPDARPLSRLHA
ncbi:PAS-domain containing protein [Jannaschia rubra]|uniref:PAS-domain containing protein n=1 Tax=Jannaschia rubra TaxID=282197 RepID=UPI002492840E|nr:PAS-domain containing protein [Jannaschia rubra]